MTAALQQWLVFAAVDTGAIPTQRERDNTKVHGCPVCSRPMVGWGHHGKGVCSVACHEQMRNRTHFNQTTNTNQAASAAERIAQ